MRNVRFTFHESGIALDVLNPAPRFEQLGIACKFGSGGEVHLFQCKANLADRGVQRIYEGKDGDGLLQEQNYIED